MLKTVKSGSGIRVDPPHQNFSKFPHFPVFLDNIPIRDVILNSSQNDQHLFVWKYLCKPSSSSSSSSSSYSSSNLTEAQIDPNPFHSLMSAIGLRWKLCKRNSEQVIDSYYSPNKHQKSQLNSVCGILFTEYPGFCFVLFKGSCINQQRFPWP